MNYQVDETHDPHLASWVASAVGHPDFPIQNLPYAVFHRDGAGPRLGVGIGDYILDLTAVAELELLDTILAAALRAETLNPVFALPAEARRDLRRRLSVLLSDAACRSVLEPHLFPVTDCLLGLPAQIGDYTDFYVGIHHATNVGRLFRPNAPLLPNYKYVPIGYHGRASSIRPSGLPVIRPNGQRKPPNAEPPDFGPSQRLDFELELGIWIAESNGLGNPVPIEGAQRHIGGFCLLNDWSARDIQAWEYQPLGPFLSKNFQSTVSPWVVTPEALAPFWRAQPCRPDGDPRPLPYLWSESDQKQGALGVQLEVLLSSSRMRKERAEPVKLSQTDASNMYWTVAQIITHHASNGCNLNPGDLLGTGTISGPTRETYGSMLEISRGGAEPVGLPTGEQRSFLEDGDEVILRASAQVEGFARIGFGDCRAIVQAAPAL
ncbi:fumarylacetoacetase [Sphingobium nicotianae]|uniref:fumarylacetoacetase n=1 Tax=Sphingobium nicotianae TaxID=2782607 RepID=A0A9X1IT56_9SPHN|nr:fumarylacetoacetase [Sphingobium nicotianae]MBT2189253.1 fumarylacetoacetase [Sphingobium nicotianae]